jgi:hypothetical protein
LFTYRKGCSAHAKAALNFNYLLEYFKINYIEPIGDNEKIKWAYLRQNPYNIDSLALRGFDDPKEIVDFVEKYINKEKTFDSILKNKLNDFYSALGWGQISESELVNNFFE